MKRKGRSPTSAEDRDGYARRLAQRERQQAAVAQLGRVAIGAQGSAQGLSSLFQLAVELLAETLECEYAKVLELLPDGKRLLLQAGVGWSEGLVGEATVSAGLESQAGYTLRSREPVVVDDLALESRFHGPPLLFDHGVTSGMSAVIGRPDSPWGVLGVHTRARARFTEDDVHFLQSFANVLAEAVAKSRSELALRESRAELARQYAELETIYEQTPVGLAVIARDLRFVRVNQILAEINGIAIEASIGRRLSELIPGELAREVEARVRAVFESGQPSGEVELEGPTAATVRGPRYWSASYHPVASTGREVDRVICVVRETTHQKLEMARREVERAVAQLLARVDDCDDAIPDILEAFALPLRFAVAEFWDLDASGRHLQRVASFVPEEPRWEEAWDAASEEIRIEVGEGLIGRAWRERQPIWIDETDGGAPDPRSRLISEIGLTGGGAMPVISGERVLGVFSFFSGLTVAGREGLIATMAQLGRDIGECWRRVRAEGALRASEQLFRDIIEQAPIPVFLHAFDGAILGVNRAFTASTGYALEDLPTKREWMREVLRVPEPEIEDRIEDLHRRLRDPSRIPEPEEVTVRTRAGRERRWVLYRCPPMRLADGREFATTMAVDVTDRRAAEEALAEAKEAAEATSRLKSAFLANVSHEIRTPMTAILGYADILGEDIEDPGARRVISTIKRNGLYLIDVIDDILDLSRIEADRLEIGLERFSPVRLLADVASLMRVRALEKDLELRVHYEGAIPATIQSDPTRLRQILINLVGNAVKFTERGEIRIVTRLLPGERLQFEVIDTGVGIDEDLLGRLFEPFVQGDSSRRGRSSGVGLGLTISRRLADALGGELTAESRAGGGSCFRLTIPTGSLTDVALDESQGAVGDLGEDVSFRTPRIDARVLVVDDHGDVRELAVELLERCGARTDSARDGDQTLARVAEARAEGAPFDVVLLDMQLPGRDGYETARLLRKGGFDGAIVALTASAMTGDRERCLDAGCSDYLTKPIVASEFLATMVRHVSETGPTEGRRGAARILLVEDDPDARVALAMLLDRRGGHRVRSARTGAEAIQLAREWPAEVVIVDLTLPDMDGFEVIGSLRASGALRDSVFIALSGRSSPDVLERSRQAGFHHHVVKPVRDVSDLTKLFPSIASST